MNGRVLDAALLTIWIATFLIVAMVHPGISNLLIGWFGLVGLGWYNSVVRHRFKDDALRAPWRRAGEVA